MGPLYQPSEWRRIMRIKDLFQEAYRDRLTWKEVASVLGVDERTVRRWKQSVNQDGFEALLDGRKRRPSPKRIPEVQSSQIKKLYRDLYQQWNVKHFHEQLSKYNIHVSYTATKNILHDARLIAKKRSKRLSHRRARERKPIPGMMLHIDGSDHRWISHDKRFYSLIVVMDDATNEVYYAKLVFEENTLECMAALRHVVTSQGIFCALYSDRAAHFFRTDKAFHPVNPDRPTQITNALNHLGIRPIPAYSPQARGRSERLFGTWQGRLPNELKFHKIKTLSDANQYIQKNFIPWHNKHLSVKSPSQGSAFSPFQGNDLDLIFSIKEQRTVQADNTIRWNNRILQIEPSEMRISFAKCKVLVHEHIDQTLSVLYGPYTIGQFDSFGNNLKSEKRVLKTAKKTRSFKKPKTLNRTNHLLHKADILTCH